MTEKSMKGQRAMSGNGWERLRGRLVVVGTSHHIAPLALRERLLAAGEAIGATAVELEESVRLRCGPCVVVSTCNRLELYCWMGRHPSAATAGLIRLLARRAHFSVEALRPHLSIRSGEDAVRHLIRVAAGLDSLALGECQVIGQVRAAWQAAAARAPVGAELDQVFRHALEAARRIRSSGALNQHPSVATTAVGAAGRALGGLAGRPAAVLGAGVTGKAAARALVAAGAKQVTLLNRSYEHAVAVAEALALPDVLAPAPLDTLPAVLRQADVVFCATAAPRQVVPAAAVAAAVEQRQGRRLVIIDVAVPRDVEPEVRRLPGVQLIDLDDLEVHCALNGASRQRKLGKLEHAEALAAEAAKACMAALRTREAVPEIVALRRHAEAIRAAELRRVLRRLGHLAPGEREAVEHLTYAIVQKLLHVPTIALRQTTHTPGAAARARRAAILAALQGPADRRYRAGGGIPQPAVRSLFLDT